MRGRRTLLVVTMLAACWGWTGLQAAGSGNPRNDRLLTLSPGQQAQFLGNGLHRGCVGVSAFPMGVTAAGAAKGTAYWSVACKNGKSYAVEIPRSTKAPLPWVDCQQLQGTGRECFKKF
jgi:hypothetical protein